MQAGGGFLRSPCTLRPAAPCARHRAAPRPAGWHGPLRSQRARRDGMLPAPQAKAKPLALVAPLMTQHNVLSPASIAQQQARLRQALELSTAQHGPQHPSTLAAQRGLTRCLTQHGLFLEAEPLAVMSLRSMQQHVQALGHDSDDALQALLLLAECLQAQGKHEAAVRWISQHARQSPGHVLGGGGKPLSPNLAAVAVKAALAASLEGCFWAHPHQWWGPARERLLDAAGDRYAEVLATLDSMEQASSVLAAEAMFGFARYDGQAASWHERALAALEQCHGAAHPDTLYALVKHRTLPSGQKHQQLQAAKESAVAQLGPDHPASLAADLYLGAWAVQHGATHFRTAQMRGGGTACIMQSVLGLQSWLTAEQGRWVERSLDVLDGNVAGSLPSEFATGFFKAADHFATQVLKCRSGGVSPVLSDSQQPLALYRRLHELAVQLYGPDHHKALLQLSRLVQCMLQLSALGEHICLEAEALCRQALASSTRALGAHHVTTLALAGQLADVLKARGCLAAAEEQALSVLQLRLVVLGPTHGDVQAAVKSLAAVRAASDGKEVEMEYYLGLPTKLELKVRSELGMPCLGDLPPHPYWI